MIYRIDTTGAGTVCGLKAKDMDQNQVLIIIGIGIVVLYSAFRSVRARGRRKLVREWLAGGSKVVDVRTSSEFGGGHFPGAVNIPLDKLDNRMKSLGSKESSIIVYCASGSRSRIAVARLKAAGFSKVVNAGAMANLPQ